LATAIGNDRDLYRRKLPMLSRLVLVVLAAAFSVTAHAASFGRDTSLAVAMVNQHRAAHGLPPVKADGTLVRAAAHQTAAMVRLGTMSHDAGGEFSSRVRSFGIRGVAAENLGYGYNDIGHAMQGWKTSYGHNANLLNPAVRRIGVVGQIGSDGRPYWTMILAQ
jgi:uncharacterized protein YkwD